MSNNVQSPFGFRPVKSPGGQVRVNYYTLASSSARVYEGDMLIISSGKAVKATAATPTAILGVAAKASGALTAAISIPVYDDPGTTFLCQGMSAATATSVGLTAPLGQTTATNVGDWSVQCVDVANTLSSLTQTVMIIGLDNRADNVSGNYADLLVKINSHLYNA